MPRDPAPTLGWEVIAPGNAGPGVRSRHGLVYDRRAKAAVFFGGVIYLLWTVQIRPVWRWVGTVGLLLLILGVAVSRLYLRSHWLSDVLGGASGGAAYLVIFLLAVDPRLRPPR